MSTQPDLFDDPAPGEVCRDFLGVPGLAYLAGFLGPEEQADALAEVDARPWLDDLRRRVQHYGYKYDYKARAIDRSMYVGPLPPFASALGQRLRERDLIREPPDQLIVNEYLPGQGIAAHIDCEPCFEDGIVTVSLGWAYEMDFLRVPTGEVRSALLRTGSALVMWGEARYGWMHRIQARKSDRGVARGRRVSLTFRNVIVEP